MENCFFSRDLFADIMSVHSRNMKHTHAIEFDYTNLRYVITDDDWYSKHIFAYCYWENNPCSNRKQEN